MVDIAKMFANGAPTADQVNEMYGGVYNPTAGGLAQPPAPATWAQFYQGILPQQQQPTRVATPAPRSNVGTPTAYDTLASMFAPSASSAPQRLAPSNPYPEEAYGHSYVAPSPFDYGVANSIDPVTGKRSTIKPAGAVPGAVQQANVPLPKPRPAHDPVVPQQTTLASLFQHPHKQPPIELTVHGPAAVAPVPATRSHWGGEAPSGSGGGPVLGNVVSLPNIGNGGNNNGLENWNRSVYEANKAVLGGSITQSSINSALSNGATLYRSR